MKEAQIRRLERRFGSVYSQKNKARRQEEVIKALLKKAAQQEKAKSFKKAVAKEIEAPRDLIREGAERLISDLKKICRNGSLMDVLGMVKGKVRDKVYSPIVLRVLIERIRRNQWDKLSQEDKVLVIQTEASLGKQIN